MVTELFVFRHGETDWNRERRFQGHTDIPLNETGLLQARDLASQVESCEIELILCSDLIRARKTAEVVNEKLRKLILHSSHLRECHLGDSEGVLREDFMKKHGLEQWERWLSVKPEDADFSFPNGESKKVHLHRLKNYLEEFCLSNPHHQRIAVSTHGGSLRQLVHHCEGAPTEAIPIPNCALYKIVFEHRPRRWIYSHRIE